jgi:hypothetical protein
VAASGAITATLGGVASAEITVLDQLLALVINEVDYDQPNADTAEFIEIYNGTASEVSLSGYALLLVNGANYPTTPASVYYTIDLTPAGLLPAGGFLVVHGGGVTPAGGALSLLVPSSTFSIQNGPTDGMALVDASSVVDAICYECSATPMTTVNLGAPYGVVSLVSGTAIAESDPSVAPPPAASLVRLQDGVDSGNDDADWGLTTTVTPGSANVVTP